MRRLRITTIALVLAALAPMAGAQTSAPAGQAEQATPMQPPAGTMGSMPMQHPDGMQPPAGAMGSMPMQHPAGMPPMAGAGPHGPMGGMPGNRMAQHGGMPAQPGQAAFGAIQEIVAMLEANPQTDWTKVDIDALREHLIDMNEVTMNAVAQKEPIDNGLRIEVTGSGRTLVAIQRMVPDHAREIDGINGWAVRTTAIPNGVELTVTTGSAVEVQKIRALGFMGIMVQGSHHQMHHLAMAKGEMMHMH
jgi:hypothetical protein